MQRVEVGNAVDAEDHGLAVDHKLLVAVSESALDDPGIPAAAVITVVGQQANAIAVTSDDQAATVVLNFVKSDGGRGDRLADGREAGRMGASHRRKIKRPGPELRIGDRVPPFSDEHAGLFSLIDVKETGASEQQYR